MSARSAPTPHTVQVWSIVYFRWGHAKCLLLNKRTSPHFLFFTNHAIGDEAANFVVKMKRLLFIVSALLLLAVVSAEAKPKRLTPTITWELQKDGTLVIKGTGKMPEFEHGKAPWIRKAKKITNINISEGITHIGNYCFYNYKKSQFVINRFSIPSTLAHISSKAISCSSIKSLQIAEGVSYISTYAFDDCGIYSVILPSTLSHIGANAFYCNNISSIFLPYGIKTIGERAFGNNRISSLVLPEGIKTISKDAFYGNKIAKLYLPSTLREIGEGAFHAYSFSPHYITNLAIPEGVTKIGDYAFEFCDIKDLSLPSTLREIGEGAFKSNSITNLAIPDGVIKIGKKAFINAGIEHIIWSPTVKEIGEQAFAKNKIQKLIIPKSVTKIGKQAFANNPLTKLEVPVYSNLQSIGYKAFAVSAGGSDRYKDFNGTLISLPTWITHKDHENIGITREAYRRTYPSSRDYYDKAEKCSDKKKAFEYYLKGTKAWDDSTYKSYTQFYKAICCRNAAYYYRSHLDDPHNALKLFEKAKELGDDDGEYWIQTVKKEIAEKDYKKRGDQEFAKGRYDTAFNYYKNYSNLVTIVPEHFEKKRDYTNAIKYYKKAYEAGKFFDKDKIAELYLKMKNYSGAIEILSKDAEKGDKDVQYKLAQVYAKSGNKNKAIFWYKKSAEQKHLKAEEALADYGIFLTQQQGKPAQKDSGSAKGRHQSSPTYNSQPYTPEYGLRDEWVQCWTCHGSGKCSSCNGNGWCISTRSDGSYNTSYQCPVCHGNGRCTSCFGSGGHYEKRQYQIR